MIKSIFFVLVSFLGSVLSSHTVNAATNLSIACPASVAPGATVACTSSFSGTVSSLYWKMNGIRQNDSVSKTTYVKRLSSGLYTFQAVATDITGKVIMSNSISVTVAVVGDVAIYVSPEGNDNNSGLSETVPVKTVGKAKNIVRTYIKAGLRGKLTIYLRKGTYQLTEGLVFDNNDSGNGLFPVTWQAYPGESPIISGGKAITGWTHEFGNVWSADATPFISPTNGYESGDNIQQLFKNGRRVPITAYPGPGVAERLTIAAVSPDKKHITTNRNLPANLGNSANFISFVQWTSSIVPVERLSSANSLQLQFPSYSPNGGPAIIPGQATCIIQNIPIESTPGTYDAWEFDGLSQRIRIRVSDLDNPANHSYIVPIADQLLVLKNAHNLKFDGISFMFGKGWEMPMVMNAQDNSFYGKVNWVNQSGHYVLYQDAPFGVLGVQKAAVLIEDSSNIDLRNSNIKHIGGTGIHVRTSSPSTQTNNVQLLFNDISDIGSNCVMLGSGVNRYSNTITDLNFSSNRIRQCGEINPAAVALWQGFTQNTRVVSNEISDQPYSGISFGWDWGDPKGSCDNTQKKCSNNSNTIGFNRISDVCKVLMDCGAIYTIGANDNSLVTTNMIYGVRLHPQSAAPINMGLYFDNASAGFTVTNNLVYDVVDPRYYMWFQNESDARIDTNFTTTNANRFTIGINYLGVLPDSPNFPLTIVAYAGPVMKTTPKEERDSLKYYWKLDEGKSTAVMSTCRNFYAGTALSPLWNLSGKFGSALYFNGSNYVTFQNKDDINMTAGNFSISFWMKSDGWPVNYISLLGKGSGGNWESGYGFVTTQNKFAFFVNGVTHAATTALPAPGIWHHVIGVYDKQYISLYVDGNLAASVPYAADVLSTNFSFQIGKLAFGGNSGFKGSIDEVKVYDEALTPAMVMSAYTNNPQMLYNWNFDEHNVNVLSSTVNGNTGIPMPAGNNPVRSKQGKVGSAMSFNGNNYIHFPNNNSMNLASGSFSISFWMKPESWPKNYISVLGKAGGSNWDSGYAFTTQVNAFTFWVNGQVNAARAPLPEPGVWHHVAATYDLNKICLYVDGSLQSSKGYASNMILTPNYFQIGKITSGGNSGFIGSIDDVRVYNRPLTSGEIQEESKMLKK